MNPNPDGTLYARLQQDLAGGTTDLYELAARHNMTRLDMARWAQKPRHARMLAALERLADRRTSLLLAAARAEAARALLELARTGDSQTKPTAHRTCIDLLKLEPAILHPDDEPTGPATAPSPESADLDADTVLDRLARHAEANPIYPEGDDGADEELGDEEGGEG